MSKDKIQVLSKNEWENLELDEYLKIEQEFHDHYAESLNWDEPIHENWSYEREGDDEYGMEVENCFVEMLGNVKGKKVLDIGSGHGSTALKLAQQGAIVTSVDIAPKLIEGCKHRAQINNFPVDFMVMDASNMNFEPEIFDIVLGFRTIHHLQDIKKFFADSKRLLKPSGFVIVVEPQKYNPFVEFGRNFIKNDVESRTSTEHPITPSDIKSMKDIYSKVETSEFEFLVSGLLFLNMIKLNFLFKLLLRPFMLIDRFLRKIPVLKPLYWQVILKGYK
jgi:2-polyprenyl-3-methyl-5-hydroxy-6-metoxy-1,4-benzoquinol methylase